MYNSSGQLVLKKKITNDTNLDITSLIKGIYVLEIKNNQGTFSMKLIKEAY
jgi:hypothetical protein